MSVIFRLTAPLYRQMLADLQRQHAFAKERVGFISVKAAKSAKSLVLLAENYFPVPDEHYIPDRSVGAMMGQEAIRAALETAMLYRVGMFHVHLHDHLGPTYFSKVDLREQVRFVPDFFKIQPHIPHGAIVLSRDAAAGRAWLAPDQILHVNEFHVVPSVAAPAVNGASNGRGISV